MLGGLDYHSISTAVKRALAGVGIVTPSLTATGDVSVGGNLAVAGVINESQAADIASAATINLDTATGNYVRVTGAIGITAITLSQGRSRTVEFAGAPVLTNGASLILPGGANITAAAGDVAIFRGEAAGVVRCVQYTKATAGVLPAGFGMSPLTNSLGADVPLNNIANYFDGPSVAQGTAGTWWASGTLTLNDTAGAAAIHVKLWDGTTVIASAVANVTGANNPITISLSGRISSPAGNIRISAKDVSSASGVMLFNSTGNSKDSTISAMRIA